MTTQLHDGRPLPVEKRKCTSIYRIIKDFNLLTLFLEVMELCYPLLTHRYSNLVVATAKFGY